jgi:hypothetical protein
MIQKILAAAIHRFVSARLESLRESLLFIFVRSVIHHPADVVNFLNSTPLSLPSFLSPPPSNSTIPSHHPPPTISALQYILNQWVALHPKLMGSRRRKSSIIGLCLLLSTSPSLLASIPSMPFLSKDSSCWYFGEIPLIIEVVRLAVKEHQRTFAQNEMKMVVLQLE